MLRKGCKPPKQDFLIYSPQPILNEPILLTMEEINKLADEWGEYYSDEDGADECQKRSADADECYGFITAAQMLRQQQEEEKLMHTKKRFEE